MDERINLNLIPSDLTEVKFKETIDWKMLIKMIVSKNILRTVTKVNNRGETFWFENELGQMTELLKKGCRSTRTAKQVENDVKNKVPVCSSILSVIYHHTDNHLKDCIEVSYNYNVNKTIGRVYPVGSLSLGCLRRELRHHLCAGKYWDIDIINAHFRIADEIFNKTEIRYPNLHNYVYNREYYLRQIGDHFKVEGYFNGLDYKKTSDYDIIKELFIRILYFGDYSTWCKDNGMPELEPPSFITEMKKEFDKIAEIIKESNPELVVWADKEHKNNVNGSITSWFFQEWERRILETIYSTLCRLKQIVKKGCVLAFDGIMIPRNKKNIDVSFLNKIIRQVETDVLDKLGFNIQLKVKPFDCLNYSDELDSIDIEYQDDPQILIDNGDDETASNILYGRIKDDLLYIRRQLYLRINNVWTNIPKDVDAFLMDFVLASEIRTTTEKGNIKCYAQSASIASRLIDVVKNKAIQHPQDHLYHLFHTTTTGKLCFEDGIFFIKDKVFRKWNDPYFKEEKNKVYSTMIINRVFEKVFTSTKSRDGSKDDLTSIKETIKETLFDKILSDQSLTMLKSLSRAMAGHFQDKDWLLWLGSRNCGKGVIAEALKTALENYFTNLPSSCLLYHRQMSSDTKNQSWLIDLQYPRIIMVQELEKDKSNKDAKKINGTTIKSINSGGDEQKARKNYQDEIDFVVGGKLFLFANDIPRVEPADVFQTCIQINSGKQFKSEEFINNRRLELIMMCSTIENVEEQTSIMKEMEIYLKCDDDIKNKCKQSTWGDALIMLIADYYCDNKLEPSNDADIKESGQDVNQVLNEMFLFGGDDKIPNDTLKVYNDNCDLGFNFQKFKNELKARGCVDYKSGPVRGLKGLSVKKKENVVDI